MTSLSLQPDPNQFRKPIPNNAHSASRGETEGIVVLT